MDTYIILGLLVGGFIIGWYGREAIAISKIKATFANTTALDLSKVQITVELKDDDIFVYERGTGTYLAHGTSLREVEAMLKEKFPDKLFAASAEDLLKLSR